MTAMTGTLKVLAGRSPEKASHVAEHAKNLYVFKRLKQRIF
jgi:hypothetical protein